MARPLFSDMLLDRRRELGLSIKQASNVLRLKEEVLIAFEEGDFDSIPKSGYAQGMLSSYARYLGLNAKTVVNQFSQDLFEHERGSNSHEARRRNRQTRGSDDGPLYETPQAAAVGRGRSNRTYVESHGFLPTSGGFAGDMGDFATTSAARPRYSSSSSESSDYDSGYPQGRPYTSRVPVTGTSVSPLGQAQRQRPSMRTTSYGARSSERSDSYDRYSRYSTTGYSSRDDITMRRVMPSQYRDDMRLDNAGTSYESASSMDGRRSSRNIASTQRPNVRRRTGSEARSRVRNRTPEPTHGGFLGMVEIFFQDRSRVLALIVILLGIILTATIILSVSSCVSSRQSTGRSVSVTSTEAEDEKKDEESDEKVTSEEEERARADAAAAKAAETESTATERTFEVSVANGEVTWLEIECDGVSDVAETVTGPWSQTYTVRKSITINVNDTSAVTVTENGKKLEFDSKASGIGTITIQVSKKGDESETTDDANGQSQDGTNADGTQTQQGQGTNTQQNGTTGDQNQQNGYSNNGNGYSNGYSDGTQQNNGGQNSFDGYTLDADGYYYGEDGYLDAQGNFYSY